jgi:hypothetical protein
MTGRARQLDVLVALAIVLLIAASLGVAALRSQVAREADHSPDDYHGLAAIDRGSPPSEVFHGLPQNRPEPPALARGCAVVYEGLHPRCRSVSAAHVGGSGDSLAPTTTGHSEPL